MEKFEYDVLLKKGFKREDCNDTVFFDLHGYNYFIFSKKLSESVYLDWDSVTQNVKIIKHNESHNILLNKKIESVEELDFIIELFKK